MIDEKQRGIRACIQIHPGDDSRIFRLGAADDILRILIDAHETEFTLKELGRETDYSRSTVWRALELLTELDIIQIRETTQRKYVSIDTEHIEKSEAHPRHRTIRISSTGSDVCSADPRCSRRH